MDLQEHGERKYLEGSDILASSLPRGWVTVAADLRRHPASELAPFRPEHMEICIATACHPECVVTRRGDGVWQRTRVEPGTIWFCSVGVLEEDIRISQWHDILHLYIPPKRFSELSDVTGSDCRPESVRYLGGLYDELVRTVGSRLLAELRTPTAGGLVLADTLSLALTARLARTYSSGTVNVARLRQRSRLDETRLRRVLEYMAAHLEQDVGLDDLAREACLSPFHFVRMFQRRLGVPPHRYLSHLRLERAKTLVAIGKMPLSEIALVSRFSSQSNFTRAFRRATGVTPIAFRDSAS